MSVDTASQRSPRASRELLVVLLLALCVCVRQGSVMPRVFATVESPVTVHTSFEQDEAVLGGDSVIADWLRSQPNAQSVSIPFEPDLPFHVEARRQRFWIALLPDVTVTADSPYLILPRHRDVPGRLVLKGEWFMLVERDQEGAP